MNDYNVYYIESAQTLWGYYQCRWSWINLVKRNIIKALPQLALFGASFIFCPVFKASTNKFDIFWQCTYIGYLEASFYIKKDDSSLYLLLCIKVLVSHFK